MPRLLSRTITGSRLVRSAVAPLLAVLLLGAATTTATAASDLAVYDRSDYRVPAEVAVDSAAIAKLLADGTKAGQITAGLASPDGSHISFRLDQVDESGYHLLASWVMRADGTHRKQLSRAAEASSPWWDEPPVWASDDVVTWVTHSPYHLGTARVWMERFDDAAGDRWDTAVHRGFVTTDGRYRVDKPVPLAYYPTWVRATDLTTGDTQVIYSPPFYGPPQTLWGAICRLPDGSMPPAGLSIEDALRGERPVCRFRQASDDDHYEDAYYVQRPLREVALPAEIAKILKGAVPLDRIGAGTYSPDGKRIAFRIRHADVPSDARGGAIWTMRTDGSERTQLSRHDAYDSLYFHDDDAFWIDNESLVFLSWGSLVHEGVALTQRVTASGATDRWEGVQVPANEQGALTVDGRYRVIKGPQLYPNASSGVDVIDLATGTKHWLMSTPNASNGEPSHWSPACDLPNGTSVSVETALRGPNPSCDFSRVLPTPTPPPSASPVASPTPLPGAAPTPSPLVTPTPTPTVVATPAPTAEPTILPSARLAEQAVPPVTIVSFAKDLKAARTKGLRVRISSTGPVAVKLWLLRDGESSLASKSIAKLSRGATTITLPRAARLGTVARPVTLRVTATDAAGKRTTVERTATLT